MATKTYSERLTDMRALSKADLTMIAEASERTIAEDRARGFETMTEVRQRLEAAYEILAERDHTCPYCSCLDSEHTSAGYCPDLPDDGQAGMSWGHR